jgi:hypothetical protein
MISNPVIISFRRTLMISSEMISKLGISLLRKEMISVEMISYWLLRVISVLRRSVMILIEMISNLVIVSSGGVILCREGN